jgi:hypothetical protein
MGRLADRLHEQNQLRPDVTPEHPEHLIWLLASLDASDQLASGSGLDQSEIIHILTHAAEHALLG